MRRPSVEARIQELQHSLSGLKANVEELRRAKEPLQRTIRQVRQEGTRQDRAWALSTRLALLENAEVREVEWTISDYSALLESCPKGQCICSPVFSAAGIPNMQLIFHPNGNKDASEGFCSIALRIPEGSCVSRVLYINHDSFGPNVVKQAVEGFSNACRVTRPSAALRGSAADVLVLGAREIYQHGWAADPMLEKVLLIGAPAAEINFQLLREQREREIEAERRERVEKEARRQEEQERKAQEAARRAAQEEAEALQQVVEAMPEPVDADEVMMQGAVKAAQARAQEAAREESPEEKAEREKKEQALAWLLEYQRKQAEEKEEAERQRLEREQAEREVKEAQRREARVEEKERERKVEMQKAEEQRLIERRAAELREQRQREEETRRREEEEERRLEEELREAEEEAVRMERQRLKEAEERRRQLEEENRRLEAARREQEEQRRKDAERTRQRQEELRRLEEQRRAFERAEEERLKAEAKRAEEAKKQEEERQAQRRLEEEQVRDEEHHREAEVAIGSGFSATRALRRNREEPSEGYAPGRREVQTRARLFEPEDSDEEEPEIFSMAKFQPARAKMGPASGSNLRAWALSAQDVEESDEEELDWMEQRRQIRAGAAAPAPKSLPSMQVGRRCSREEDSGSDVEPVFFR